MSDRQPNLLFIYADQHRADVMGCAGNDIVVTPHLDRLASEGVRFDQTWTESPICQPARASLLTGRYPTASSAVKCPASSTFLVGAEGLEPPTPSL